MHWLDLIYISARKLHGKKIHPICSLQNFQVFQSLPTQIHYTTVDLFRHHLGQSEPGLTVPNIFILTILMVLLLLLNHFFQAQCLTHPSCTGRDITAPAVPRGCQRCLSITRHNLFKSTRIKIKIRNKVQPSGNFSFVLFTNLFCTGAHKIQFPTEKEKHGFRKGMKKRKSQLLELIPKED